ncbi:MAG: hypothetical protein LBC38_01105 [Oscillospiraceae bacterium]|jgi:hypothetical protein|nr:hypothetical protein [Oscillospiraceae bacterium]
MANERIYDPNWQHGSKWVNPISNLTYDGAVNLAKAARHNSMESKMVTDPKSCKMFNGATCDGLTPRVCNGASRANPIKCMFWKPITPEEVKPKKLSPTKLTPEERKQKNRENNMAWYKANKEKSAERHRLRYMEKQELAKQRMAAESILTEGEK